MRGISERNPFVGPRPIQRGEPLHGREAELRELYHRLQARRIVVLHSPSGAGKSSLVEAGLIPRLTEGGYDVWRPIRVNLDPSGIAGVPPGTNRYLLSVLVSLEEELPAERRRGPAQLAELGLLAYLRGRPRRKGRADRPVVLIFDQFEEILTVAPVALAEKRDFFAALGEALEVEGCWALFVIREDFLGALAPFRDRIPTQLSNTFRLDLLGLAGAREAAEKLALAGGRAFPGVDRLIRDLSQVQVQQPDGNFVVEQGLHVEPVQLQVVCRRLWDAMPEDDLSIDPEDIAAYASVSQSLGGYYAETVAALSSGARAVERRLREWVGKKLIVGGIRSQVRREAGASAGLDNHLIARLLGSYLVRVEPRAGADWFELSHDRLVEPVLLDNQRWETTHLHPLQVQARLWEDARRSAALLLGAEALASARGWARENPSLLTEGEREFLALSEQERAKERAARRRLIALAAAAATAAVIVGALGLLARSAQSEAQAALALAQSAQAEADEQRDAAKDAARTAKALARRARDASLMAGVRELLPLGERGPLMSLLLEVAAPESVRGWADLARSVLLLPSASSGGGGIVLTEWSPDGQRLLTVSRDKTAQVWLTDGSGPPLVLRCHGGSITGVEWSPDSKRLFTGCDDHSARVWPVAGSGAPVVLRGHEGLITAVRWSADGKEILTGSEDNTARVWQADGSVPSRIFAGHTEAIEKVKWSADGRQVLATTRQSVRVWHVDGSGAPVVLPHEKEGVYDATWSPDGRQILVETTGETVHVWPADGGGRPLVLRGAGDDVQWSPDGQRILATSESAVWVWRADGKGKPLVLRGEIGAWSPDGRSILVTSEDAVTVWRADGKGKVRVLRGAVQDAAMWSPDGRSILAVFEDAVKVLRADATGEPVVLARDAEDAAWSPDSRRVLTTSGDGTVRVWPAEGGADALILKGKSSRKPAEWSPDGLRVLTRDGDPSIQVSRADGSGSPITLPPPAEKLAGLWNVDEVDAAVLSPDGQRLLTRSQRSDQLKVWPLDGSADAVVLGRVEGMAEHEAWSPDSRRILTIEHKRDPSLRESPSTIVRVWRADGGGVPILLTHHPFTGRESTAAAWSTDGRAIVITREGDHDAQVWQVDGSAPHRPLIGHTEGLTSAVWSPDGRSIVTTSGDKTARVWAVDGSAPPVVLTGHEDPVSSATWSPDGLRLVTVSTDKTARVWQAGGSGTPVVLAGHQGAVQSAAWSADGEAILTTSADGTARVWRADGSGKAVVLQGHRVHSASWSPDGQKILTRSAESVRVWPASGTRVPVILEGSRSSLEEAVWSPDSREILTTSRDGTRVWRADGSGEPLAFARTSDRVKLAAWSSGGRELLLVFAGGTAILLPSQNDALRQRLADAARECLMPELRVTYLDEEEADAQVRYEACEREHGRVPRVILRERPNYAGASQSFEVGMFDTAALGKLGDDAASSIRVPAGVRVTLFEDAGFTGHSRVVTADTPDLDDFDDRTSSLTVELVAPP